MVVRTLLTALVIVAVPMTVQGAQEPPKSTPPAKRVCSVDTTIGTRLGNTRRCRSREEREEAKDEARQVVDRIQRFKVTCNGGLC